MLTLCAHRDMSNLTIINGPIVPDVTIAYLFLFLLIPWRSSWLLLLKLESNKIWFYFSTFIAFHYNCHRQHYYTLILIKVITDIIYHKRRHSLAQTIHLIISTHVFIKIENQLIHFVKWYVTKLNCENNITSNIINAFQQNYMHMI